METRYVVSTEMNNRMTELLIQIHRLHISYELSSYLQPLYTATV